MSVETDSDAKGNGMNQDTFAALQAKCGYSKDQVKQIERRMGQAA